jgi:hypothetical protein
MLPILLMAAREEEEEEEEEEYDDEEEEWEEWEVRLDFLPRNPDLMVMRVLVGSDGCCGGCWKGVASLEWKQMWECVRYM